jgi:hypothetical protein
MLMKSIVLILAFFCLVAGPANAQQLPPSHALPSLTDQEKVYVGCTQTANGVNCPRSTRNAQLLLQETKAAITAQGKTPQKSLTH